MPLIIFLLITFSGTPFSKDPEGPFLVIWNVGQGQWVTAVTQEDCLHFDMGGEFFPLKQIKKKCSKKTNQAFLSHGDWDHISALKKLKNVLPNLCIAEPPKVLSSKNKRKWVQSWPRCTTSLAHQKIHRSLRTESSNSNESSTVFGYRRVLLPGDSPKSQEAFWQNLSWVQRSQVLVLGHHGSQTSTSASLLAHLPQLKFAISSSRWARYRHPSPQVVLLLKKFRVPLLKTEDWGNIWYSIEK